MSHQAAPPLERSAHHSKEWRAARGGLENPIRPPHASDPKVRCPLSVTRPQELGFEARWRPLAQPPTTLPDPARTTNPAGVKCREAHGPLPEPPAFHQ